MPASASPPPSPPVRTPGQQPSHPASATNRSCTPQNDRFALYSPRNPDRRWIRAKEDWGGEDYLDRRDAGGTVVRIGNGHARIHQITSERVEYAFEAGQPDAIDLDECTRNWVQMVEKSRENFVDAWPGSQGRVESNRSWNSACVGMRDTTAERPWVTFMTELPLRLEFEDYDALYSELLDPLAAVGKHTFDTT